MVVRRIVSNKADENKMETFNSFSKKAYLDNISNGNDR